MSSVRKAKLNSDVVSIAADDPKKCQCKEKIRFQVSAKYQITIGAAKLPICQKLLNTLTQAQIQRPDLMLGEI